MAFAFRLLALLALILTPMSMAVTPAHAHGVAEAAAAHLCDEQGEVPVSKSTDCVAMCAALPALGATAWGSQSLSRLSRLIGLAEPIVGIIPEIATPPPKHPEADPVQQFDFQEI